MAARKARDEEEKPKSKEPEERPEPAQAAGDDAVVEIEVGDPAAEEEDDDEDDSTEVVDDRPSRQQKKRARRNEFEEARARAARADALEAENLRMKQEWAQYQQGLQSQHYQQHYQQQIGHEEQRYRDDLKTFYQALESQRATMTPEQSAEFERKAMELKEREFRIFSAKHGTPQQQVNPQQIAAYVEGEQLKAKHADIFANENARRWGEGRLYQLAAMRGITAQNVTKAQYYELIEQAAEDTRKEFRMNGHSNPHATRRPAPDAATKARFSGVSARASGGTGEVVRVTIGKAQRQLARGAFPDDTEEVAIQKWAKGPGRRAALAAQKSR